MQLIEQQMFNKFVCAVYMDKQGNILMTREQIGRALEYKNPNDAIRLIHDRNKERLDRFSVSFKLNGTDGKKYNQILYTRRGIYEICRHSKQPKADEFYDWVYDLLEDIEQGQVRIAVQKESKLWKNSRIRCKDIEKVLCEAIKRLVDYAISQGSKHAKTYYVHFNKLVNSLTDIYSRDNCDLMQLNAVYNALKMAVVCINEGMAKNLHYKAIYHECKMRLQTAKDWGLLKAC